MFFSVRVMTTEGSAIFLLIAFLSTVFILQVDARCGEKMSRMLLLLGHRSDPLLDRENVLDMTTVRVGWVRFKCPRYYYSGPLSGGQNVRDITTARAHWSGLNVLVITTVGLFQAIKVSVILLRSAALAMDSVAFSERKDKAIPVRS